MTGTPDENAPKAPAGQRWLLDTASAGKIFDVIASVGAKPHVVTLPPGMDNDALCAELRTILKDNPRAAIYFELPPRTAEDKAKFDAALQSLTALFAEGTAAHKDGVLNAGNATLFILTGNQPVEEMPEKLRAACRDLKF